MTRNRLRIPQTVVHINWEGSKKTAAKVFDVYFQDIIDAIRGATGNKKLLHEITVALLQAAWISQDLEAQAALPATARKLKNEEAL